MFTKKTLFVVGAGASVEFGLPAAVGLKSIIKTMLDIRHSPPADPTGDHRIIQCLQGYAQARGEDYDDYRRVACQVANAMPLAQSIDNYIDAHRDPKIELVGKLAIAQVGLEHCPCSEFFGRVAGLLAPY